MANQNNYINSHSSLPKNPNPLFVYQSTPDAGGNTWNYQTSFSSHYAQAYMNNEGYSYSSTYNPQQQRFSHSGFPPALNTSQHAGPSRPRTTPPQGSWYQQGNVQCTHATCTFRGSKKSVEIHMMDRHLIFPPDWHKRPRKVDWDADPSLKGKPIPILGTSVVLDSPETLDAWIAERRKRWPSASRVQEKAQKMEDAIARGQVISDDVTLGPRKRLKQDERHDHRTGLIQHQRRGRGRGAFRGRGRDHFTPRTTTERISTNPCDATWPPNRPASPKAIEDSSEISSDSDSDIDPERDAISSKTPVNPMLKSDTVSDPVIVTEHEDFSTTVSKRANVKLVSRKPPPRPKLPPRNPFSGSPALLRQLLIPEIRVTVSNFSQAIHFLVENDFLVDVELKPGDAENIPIQIINNPLSESSEVSPVL